MGYPQSNGLVENGVKIVKLLIKKALDSKSDPYLALLNYRDTPLKHGKSPAEMLFNRKLKTRLPLFLESESDRRNNNKVQQAKEKNKHDQKRYYDKGARSLKPLYPGDRVKMHDGKGWNVEARLVKGVAPRSYDAVTWEGVTYRRNRRHLLLVPQLEPAEPQESEKKKKNKKRNIGTSQTTRRAHTAHTDGPNEIRQSGRLAPSHTTDLRELRKSSRTIKVPQRLIEQI